MNQQFDTCTRPLGALRQSLFSCLTCNPPPASSSDPYSPAGVCYSCSISCHGEHTLVELFSRRDFVCDCGTTRLPSSCPCTLRLNEATGAKGGVHSEKPAQGNRYNQNFRNRFCGCGEDYDAHQEKGTMFQCLGLGTTEDGGCGEDWWHPECVVGLGREAYRKSIEKFVANKQNVPANAPENGISVAVSVTLEGIPAGSAQESDSVTTQPAVTNETGAVSQIENGGDETVEDDDPPPPPGFPKEDDFETFICYKCADAFPWIKRYAGTPGFLPAVYFRPSSNEQDVREEPKMLVQDSSICETASKKRKADDDETTENESHTQSKRQKSEAPLTDSTSAMTSLSLTPKKPSSASMCHLETLPPASNARLSLFIHTNFRDHLCHCASCFPLLKPHPQLLEEEETYEPPISEDGEGEQGGSVGTGSLLDRGEAAFNNMDRVRAIGAYIFSLFLYCIFHCGPIVPIC
jgi:E3 ubiquitin-protein ligase UBR7